MTDLAMVRKVEELDRRVLDLERLEVLAVGGTAFPSGPATNALFYRTDLDWWCFYDGTRWLTVHEYCQPIGEVSTAGAAAIRSAIRFSDYTTWYTRVTIRAFVTAPNSGVNYWTLSGQTTNTSIASATVIYGPNTSADGAGAWLAYEGITTNSPGSNNAWFRLNCVPTGAPGALVANATTFFRLVVT